MKMLGKKDKDKIVAEKPKEDNKNAVSLTDVAKTPDTKGSSKKDKKKDKKDKGEKKSTSVMDKVKKAKADAKDKTKNKAWKKYSMIASIFNGGRPLNEEKKKPEPLKEGEVPLKLTCK